MRDDGSEYEGENVVGGKQCGGETLGARGIRRQTDFEHITQNGNNEAEDEGFYRSAIGQLKLVANNETMTYQGRR